MPNLEPVAADVLIVTVTPVESRAVLEAFRQATGHIAKSITLGDRVYRDLGTINGANVFMALSEMGAGGLGAAQQAVQKGITALHPHAVIMVGIAFGANEQKQAIGDILVSKQLMLYDSQRVGKGGEIVPRGDRPHSATRLINYLQNAHLNWQGAEVRFGLVLTGEKLVDNLDYRESLKKLESEAIGGEMERAGLYVSCQDAKVDWILVKAICDWADGNKDHDKKPRQQQAAENAAAFVLYALQHQHAPLTQPASHRSEPSQVISIEKHNETTPTKIPNPPKIDLTRLPQPASNQFIGRKVELAKLNAAFNNRAETGIVAIIADGGIGKSAFTYYWITALKKSNYGGIKRVLAFSFYSQGSHQNTFTNSTEFFTVALPFFGFKGELPKDDVEKARALAQRINEQPALLLLDGLEPLQHPVDILGGEMADTGMKELLLCLHHHRHPQTFVLISSRQPIVELNGRDDYQEIPLNTLSDSDGAALLQALKVKGTTEECEAVSSNLSGHALSLVLLASLLTQHHHGDIRYANELPPLEDSDTKHGGHAKRVLTYYDRLLSDHERRFMHCLALFDRPMHWQEQRALFDHAEHAAPLTALSDSEWQSLQHTLENKRLLLKEPDLPGLNHHRTQWDTHPLIRQFFSRQFQHQHPQAFQQAHHVLFDYYQTVPEKYQPDTLEELEPLYRAVAHGCLAGEYQKAQYKTLYGVYLERIRRGNEAYSIHKLGAYSQDLIALSAFFPQGWSQPVSRDWTKGEQALLLDAASFCLMSLGRLAEAVAPRVAITNLAAKFKDWKKAATSAENFTDLLLPLGKLNQAKTAARQAIKYAHRDKLRQMVSYSKLATLLHRLGQLEQAQRVFAQSEQCQQQYEPYYLYLYSLPGALYCGFLLDIASNTTDLDHVLERGKYALKIKTTTPLLDYAFNCLTIARTYQALHQPQTAGTEFNSAVQAIQKVGKIQYMPAFYLARADFYLSQNQLTKAKPDSETANQIIARCGMKLYAVDAALLQGRYYLALNNKKVALRFCDQAEMLIVETGYHLRDKVLAALKQSLRNF